MERITTFATIKYWFLVNFTDKASRIDTGRISQFFGVFLMTCVTWFVVYALIWNASINMEIAKYLTGTGGMTMLFYRLKEFSGSSGTSFERKEITDPLHFKGVRGFLRRNFTVGMGRLDTGRIGQINGVLAIAIIVSYTVYGFVFYPLFTGGQMKIDPDKLGLVLGDAGIPMLLYRAKEFADKARNLVAVTSAPANAGEGEDDTEGSAEKKATKAEGDLR